MHSVSGGPTSYTGYIDVHALFQTSSDTLTTAKVPQLPCLWNEHLFSQLLRAYNSWKVYHKQTSSEMWWKEAPSKESESPVLPIPDCYISNVPGQHWSLLNCCIEWIKGKERGLLEIKWNKPSSKEALSPPFPFSLISLAIISRSFTLSSRIRLSRGMSLWLFDPGQTAGRTRLAFSLKISWQNPSPRSRLKIWGRWRLSCIADFLRSRRWICGFCRTDKLDIDLPTISSISSQENVGIP